MTPIQELISFLEPELKMQDFLQLPAYEKAKSLLEKEERMFIDACYAGKLMQSREGDITPQEYYKSISK